MLHRPGLIVMFGSGETSASGRGVWAWLLRQLPQPLSIGIMETPAGFQPNSALVAGKIGEFLTNRLQEFRPQVTVIPARGRHTPYSPDDPSIIEPMLKSHALFLGPGSPTYAARHLKDSLAWHTLLSRHLQGTAIVLASAAAISCGRYTLPVYEIYKAGEDLHWKPGLDWLAAYGLPLVIVSHWNNNEGGAELDTSRCFMGQERFAKLLSLLPASVVLVGIDEHTALIVDLSAGQCFVRGKGHVTILSAGFETVHQTGRSFAARELGPFSLPEVRDLASAREDDPAALGESRDAPLQDPTTPSPPQDVLDLVAMRESARARRDWAQSDELRQAIAARGWQVRDTPHGPDLRVTTQSTN